MRLQQLIQVGLSLCAFAAVMASEPLSPAEESSCFEDIERLYVYGFNTTLRDSPLCDAYSTCVSLCSNTLQRTDFEVCEHIQTDVVDCVYSKLSVFESCHKNCRDGSGVVAIQPFDHQSCIDRCDDKNDYRSEQCELSLARYTKVPDSCDKAKARFKRRCYRRCNSLYEGQAS